MMDFPKYVFAASCLVFLGGCAANNAVEETATANVSAPATEQVDAEGAYVNKVVCKRILPTGSRTNAQKTCATVAEWEELSRASQEAVNERSRRGVMDNRMDGNGN